jgi:hypothetical protein
MERKTIILLTAILLALVAAGAFSVLFSQGKREVIVSQESTLTQQTIEQLPSRELRRPRVLERLTSYSTSLSQSTRLGLLIVGNNKEALRLAANGPSRGWGLNDFSQDLKDLELGEVFSFNGRVTIRLRHHDNVEELQVHGRESAREISVAGVNAKVVGFRERAFPPGTANGALERRREVIWFYLKVGRLPPIAKAAEMTEALASIVDSNVFSVFRTDTYFGYFDGPAVDLFDPGQRGMGFAAFAAAPYLVCVSANTVKRCREELPGRQASPLILPSELQ